MSPVTPAPTFTATPIRWINLVWVALSLAIMIAAIWSESFLFLNFVHVASGMLWTGIDLFMGFVIGPALRAAPFESRREISTRITPKTIFILPALAIITGTSGWYLAKSLGYLEFDYPAFWWVLAALALLTLLTIQGLGILLPTQIRVYRELCKPEPDRAKIMRLNASYFYLIAMQGLMQVLIVLIMAKFRVGL